MNAPERPFGDRHGPTPEEVAAGIAQQASAEQQLATLGAMVREAEARRNAQVRADALREAADLIDNDDTCDCGGCDTCQPKALAAMLRDHADAIAPPTTEEPTP